MDGSSRCRAVVVLVALGLLVPLAGQAGAATVPPTAQPSTTASSPAVTPAPPPEPTTEPSSEPTTGPTSTPTADTPSTPLPAETAVAPEKEPSAPAEPQSSVVGPTPAQTDVPAAEVPLDEPAPEPRDFRRRNHVFADQNVDGVLQPGEAPVSGLGYTVELACDGRPPVTSRGVTNAQGDYVIVGRAIRCDFTVQLDAALVDGTVVHVLSDGADRNARDGRIVDRFTPDYLVESEGFGVRVFLGAELPRKTLSGFVYRSLDGLPHDVGSPLAEGIDTQVVLFNGDPGCPDRSTVPTGADGTWQTQVRADCPWFVSYVDPPGLVSTVQGTGSASVPTGLQDFFLAYGVMTSDPGNPPTSHLTPVRAVVFHDLDRDGVRDVGEPGVPRLGYEMSVSSCRVPPFTGVASGVTDADGVAASTLDIITSAPRCSVAVRVSRDDPVTGISWRLSTNPQSGVNGLVLIELDGPNEPLELGAVPSEPLPDPATTRQLRGVVYDDVNEDGVRQPGERPISGLSYDTRTTCVVGGVTQAPVSRTGGTLADGTYYTPPRLIADSCSVRVTFPARFSSGEALRITSDGSGNLTDGVIEEVLTTPQRVLDVGTRPSSVYPTSLLEGSVYGSPDGHRWVPADGNALGLNGVQVDLTASPRCVGGQDVTVVTHDHGYWSAQVTDGCTYTIEITDPPGVAGVVQGSRVSYRGDFDRRWVTYGVTMSTAPNPTPDVHTGTVWQDRDGNGVWDGRTADPGVDGVTVVLTPTGACVGGPVVRTQTFANGYWEVVTAACDFAVTYEGLPGFGTITRTSSPTGDAQDVVRANNNEFDGVFGRIELGYLPV